VSLGDDIYLYDGHNLHSYSKENNQVIIEAVDPESDVGREVTFLIRLEELFETESQTTKNSWRLLRRKGTEEDLPDSMVVTINSDRLQIDRLEFYDINDEFNIIELHNQQLDSTCTTTDFVPNFPDSVETVKMR
jgi:outer membrane lipoprotein-sorting protein